MEAGTMRCQEYETIAWKHKKNDKSIETVYT